MPALRRIAWLTSLSLDAPLVAVVWQRAVAQSTSANLEWRHYFLVFASVWLGYSADRWLDAWKHDLNLTQRHAFHASRRWTLLAIWICVLALSVSFAAVSLHTDELKRGITLAIASILVTAIIQLGSNNNRHGVAKSLLTSGLVTASVIVFLPPALVREEVPTVIMVFFLFNLNCSCIHYWDLPIDSKQESNHNGKWIETNAIVSFIPAAVSTFFLIHSPLAIYSSLSITGLFLRHWKHKKLDTDLKRSFADISLLTPVLRIAKNLV